MTKLLISILNWNSSERTLECVRSLLANAGTGDYQADIRVIDNASRPEQAELLQQLPPEVELLYNPENSGFAGGQNINIRYAMEHGYDYVWLLNNDTVVYPDTVDHLIAAMEADPGCGAASPVILRLGQPGITDFIGAVHDWKNIDTLRPDSPEQAPQFLERHRQQVWAVGTALMLRVATVRQIGGLDERFFAYYEDDDLGARLIATGWRTRIVLDARLEHACFEGDMYQRPPYFFYLMTRNAIFFALKHVPSRYRKSLRLRYLDRSIVMADKLRSMGHADKASACLLGLADGLAGRGGAPVLGRPLPLWLRGTMPLSRFWNRLA